MDELTLEDIKEMNATTINANWDEVQAAMVANRHREVDEDEQADEEPAKPTEMSWQRIRAMSEAEHVMWKREIDAFLSKQGRAA